MKKQSYLPLVVGKEYVNDNRFRCVITGETKCSNTSHGHVLSNDGSSILYAMSWHTDSGSAYAGCGLPRIVGAAPKWDEAFPWDIILPEYTWAAMDKGGTWWIYDSKPRIRSHQDDLWVYDGKLHRELPLVVPAPPSWEESLTRRP